MLANTQSIRCAFCLTCQKICRRDSTLRIVRCCLKFIDYPYCSITAWLINNKLPGLAGSFFYKSFTHCPFRQDAPRLRKPCFGRDSVICRLPNSPCGRRHPASCPPPLSTAPAARHSAAPASVRAAVQSSPVRTARFYAENHPIHP